MKVPRSVGRSTAKVVRGEYKTEKGTRPSPLRDEPSQRLVKKL